MNSMATIRERLDADLKEAMRAKAELKLMIIRAVKSAIKYKEVEGTNKVLDDEGILSVISTEVKKRREAAAEYKAAGRAELAQKEEDEVALLMHYLPEQLSPEALAKEVAACIAEANAKGPKDMGAVMKIASAKLKGKAEGRLISDAVKTQLAALS
jgi:uncharacterized protein